MPSNIHEFPRQAEKREDIQLREIQRKKIQLNSKEEKKNVVDKPKAAEVDNENEEDKSLEVQIPEAIVNKVEEVIEFDDEKMDQIEERFKRRRELLTKQCLLSKNRVITKFSGIVLPYIL